MGGKSTLGTLSQDHSIILFIVCVMYTVYVTLHDKTNHIALDTVWRVIFVGANFCGKSEKALKINFRDSNQPRGVALLHKR